MGCCVTAVLGRSGEVGEETSPGAGRGQHSSGQWHLGPKLGCAGQQRMPRMGRTGGWAGQEGGQDIVTRFPQEPACWLLAQLPVPKCLGLGFLSWLQVFLRLTCCRGFSDFCQLLTCETGFQSQHGTEGLKRTELQLLPGIRGKYVLLVQGHAFLQVWAVSPVGTPGCAVSPIAVPHAPWEVCLSGFCCNG